jgi:5'-3' exonuclease
MNKPTEAILDGDIIAYRAAFWADQEGIDYLPERISKDIANWTPQNMEQVYIAMSCPRETNYRRSFWPNYKKHREDFKPPDSMKYAIECIYNSNITVRCVNRLEADDLIGMLVSDGRCIGVTVDKDLRQIPGWHWNPDKETDPILVSQEDADRFFYQQWITGDTTDNIWGLWKFGPAKAKKILDSHPRETWDTAIMELYASENWDKRPEDKVPEEMTREEFALSQARCVRILRNGDYNKETKQITLWSPNNLTVRNILDLSEGEKNEQGV